MPQILPDVLAAVASELRSLVVVASDIQDSISPLTNNDVDVETLQGLDILHQTLSCLETYLIELSLVVPRDCKVNLDTTLGSMTLSSLASRLSGQEPSPSSSDLELF